MAIQCEKWLLFKLGLRKWGLGETSYMDMDNHVVEVATQLLFMLNSGIEGRGAKDGSCGLAIDSGN